MKFIRFISQLSLLLILIISCNKENVDENVSNPSTSNQSIKDLFSSYRNGLKQHFIVPANDATEIYAAGGTTLALSGFNFLDENFNIINGDVQIEFIEIYSKTDMILSRRTTQGEFQGNTYPLVSGGEFYLNVTYNNAPVNIIEPIIVLTTPIFEEPNMNLFTGLENSEDNVSWTLNSDSVNIQFEAPNFSYMFAFNPNYSWMNCDYFWDNSNVTAVTINAPVGCSQENTSAFIVLKNKNSVMEVYHGGNNNQFISPAGYGVGSDVYFVMISYTNGQLKYSLTSNIISTNHVETVSQLTNVENMETLMGILNGIL